MFRMGVVPDAVCRAAAVVLCAVLLTPPLYAQSNRPEVQPSVPSRETLQKKRIALVIGNAAYRSLTVLDNPVNDASDICAATKKVGFKTTCLFNIASRRELREAIRVFTEEANGSAETLFYYAGHGLQYNGENYFIPTEAQILGEPDIDFEGVGLSYLLQSLAQARSHPNLIILDACRDNPFGTNTRINVLRGLARIDPPVGTVLTYATSPNKAALDGKGRNGLFTKHLLSHLTMPGLQLDEMLRKVSKGVEDEARKAYRFEQVPYRSSSYSDSYCLAGCDDPLLADRIKGIEQQRNELNRRLEEVSNENARLRAKADSGAGEIEKLERRIARLLDEGQAKGAQDSAVRTELDRARAELSAVKGEQSRRSEAERETEKRMRELEALRAELQKQSTEINEYRRQLKELESAKRQSLDQEDTGAPAKAAPRRVDMVPPSF